MARADGDGETVAAGAGHELLHVLGTGVGAVLGFNVNVVLHAGERTQLRLDDDAVVVRVLNDLAGESDVVLKGLAAAVDHDGGEAAVDAALAKLKAVAVVKMQCDRKSGLLLGSLDELDEIGVVGVGACAAGDLQNDGGLDLSGSLGDALNDLHVVDVESAYGIAALIRLAEHFFCGYDRHDILPPLYKVYGISLSIRHYISLSAPRLLPKYCNFFFLPKRNWLICEKLQKFCFSILNCFAFSY